MKTEIKPCHPDHIRLLAVQNEQQADHGWAIGNGQQNVLAGGLGFSVWESGVRCVCCAGVSMMWPGHGFAWAFFSAEARPHMRSITRFAAQILDAQPYRRVHTTALVGFEPAKRWLEMLAFKVEAPCMKGYDVSGQDHALYARVRD